MDWVAFWTAVAAIAAILAAVGTVGTLLAATLQLHLARVDREDDYYRNLTPFLSFDFDRSEASYPSTTFAIETYADGGGVAFNVSGQVIDDVGSTDQGSPASNYLAYLRQGDPRRIEFHTPIEHREQRAVRLRFQDMFGNTHQADQRITFISGVIKSTDALAWTCSTTCHVHVTRPAPKPGLMARIAQALRLY